MNPRPTRRPRSIPRFRSIRAKLVLGLGVPLLVSYVALLSVDFVFNRRTAVAQLQGAILERAEGSARVIDSRLMSVAQLAQSVQSMAANNSNAAATGDGRGANGAARAGEMLRDALNNRFVTSATLVLAGDGDGAPAAYVARRATFRDFPGGNAPFGGNNPFGGSATFGGNGPRDGTPPRDGSSSRDFAAPRDASSPRDPASPREANPAREANPPREFGQPRDASTPREPPATRDAGPNRFPRRGGGGGFFGPQVAEPTAVPEWYADARSMTAGRWMIAPAQQQQQQQPSGLYVEPIRVEGRVVGAIALEVSLRSLRTLRPGGPPPELAAATSRPAAEPDAPPAETAASPELAATSASSSRLIAAEAGDFAIFDADGRLVVAASGDEPNPPAQTLFETARAIGSTAMADAARRAIAGDSEVVSVSGLRSQISGVPADRDHWLAMAPIPSANWFLVAAVGESQYLRPVMQRLVQRALFLAGGLVVMLLVVLVISMRMSRRIERLDAAVARLATGDLDAPVPEPDSADEIGRLTRGVANMSRELREHVAELTRQSAEREKAQGELRVARQIQLDLLPRTFPPFPHRREFELHAINEPARDVAGDFYDFFFTGGKESGDGLLTVVVADVSGKGVPAALLMAVTRTLVRTLAGNEGRGPAEILRGVNAALASDSGAEMFATMFLCQYQPATGEIRYVNAGHPPPLRLRRGAPPTPFCDHGSPIVGLDEPELGDFEEGTERLEPGDAMLIYTDGVTDAPGASGDDFLGAAGLIALLKDAGGASPREVCERLMREIVGKKASRLRDDTTVLALRRAE